ncbi:hypothetical protein AgCh_011479 [Apium graveolens]
MGMAKDRSGTEGSISRKKSSFGRFPEYGRRQPDDGVDRWQPWLQDDKRFNGGSHIRFKAQLSTKFSDYKIMLKICGIARATI